jgi:hypothetical protein
VLIKEGVCAFERFAETGFLRDLDHHEPIVVVDECSKVIQDLLLRVVRGEEPRGQLDLDRVDPAELFP